MAAASEKTDKMSAGKSNTRIAEETTITEKLNIFLQKNRRILLLGVAGLAFILAAFIIILSVREKLRENAFFKLDEFYNRYQTLMSVSSEDVTETYSIQGEISSLLADLEKFAKKNSGFATARSYSLIASVYEDQTNWIEAEKAWSASAKAGAKTYLAPVALFNAAVAAEEQGKIDSAIDLYAEAANFGSAFPGSARAQFSIGRLHESRNNISAALEAYRYLLSRWPGDPLWANLAQSRIIVLSD